MRALPGRVGLPQLGLDPGQGLPERLDELLDGVAAGVELAGRAEIGRPQPDFADLEQPPLASVKRLRRQRLEPFGEVAVDQRRLLLRGAGPLVSGTGLCGEVDRGAGQAVARVQEADHGAQDHPDAKAGQQRCRVHVRLCFQPALTVPGSDTRGIDHDREDFRARNDP